MVRVIGAGFGAADKESLMAERADRKKAGTGRYGL